MSINQWHEGWEYEDDHCYYLFVHRMVSEHPFLGSRDAQALIARFETVLDGQASSRLDLCKAVQIGDTNAFGEALEQFLNERKQLLDARRETITEYTAQAIFWPQSFVSLEALAWLRLAETAGIEMKDDFLFCPPEARGRRERLQVEDFFADLDRALAQEG